MHPHIGLDHLLGYRFQVIELNAESQTVLIHYEETAWPQDTARTLHLPWTDFVNHLISGRFEIHRALTPTEL